MSETDIEALKKQVALLADAVTKLVNQQTRSQTDTTPQVQKEELVRELKNIHLGELVIYAIKKDLIERTSNP